jgi:hypothetical protein
VPPAAVSPGTRWPPATSRNCSTEASRPPPARTPCETSRVHRLAAQCSSETGGRASGSPLGYGARREAEPHRAVPVFVVPPSWHRPDVVVERKIHAGCADHRAPGPRPRTRAGRPTRPRPPRRRRVRTPPRLGRPAAAGAGGDRQCGRRAQRCRQRADAPSDPARGRGQLPRLPRHPAAPLPAPAPGRLRDQRRADALVLRVALPERGARLGGALAHSLPVPVRLPRARTLGGGGVGRGRHHLPVRRAEHGDADGGRRAERPHRLLPDGPRPAPPLDPPEGAGPPHRHRGHRRRGPRPLRGRDGRRPATASPRRSRPPTAPRCARNSACQRTR